jgi:hypothetical protein
VEEIQAKKAAQAHMLKHEIKVMLRRNEKQQRRELKALKERAVEINTVKDRVRMISERVMIDKWINA